MSWALSRTNFYTNLENRAVISLSADFIQTSYFNKHFSRKGIRTFIYSEKDLGIDFRGESTHHHHLWFNIPLDKPPRQASLLAAPGAEKEKSSLARSFPRLGSFYTHLFRHRYFANRNRTIFVVVACDSKEFKFIYSKNKDSAFIFRWDNETRVLPNQAQTSKLHPRNVQLRKKTSKKIIGLRDINDLLCSLPWRRRRYYKKVRMDNFLRVGQFARIQNFTS